MDVLPQDALQHIVLFVFSDREVVELGWTCKTLFQQIKSVRMLNEYWKEKVKVGLQFKIQPDTYLDWRNFHTLLRTKDYKEYYSEFDREWYYISLLYPAADFAKWLELSIDDERTELHHIREGVVDSDDLEKFVILSDAIRENQNCHEEAVDYNLDNMNGTIISSSGWNIFAYMAPTYVKLMIDDDDYVAEFLSYASTSSNVGHFALLSSYVDMDALDDELKCKMADYVGEEAPTNIWYYAQLFGQDMGDALLHRVTSPFYTPYMSNDQFEEHLEVLKLTLEHATDNDLKSAARTIGSLAYHERDIRLIKVILGNARVDKTLIKENVIKNFCRPFVTGTTRSLKAFNGLQSIFNEDIEVYIKQDVLKLAKLDLALHLLSLKQIPEADRKKVEKVFGVAHPGAELLPYNPSAPELTKDEVKMVIDSLKAIKRR